MKNKNNKQSHASQQKLFQLQSRLQKALQRCDQLDDIKKKIELSKPLLQTIYKKIKKRENIYRSRIQQQVNQKKQAIHKANQYMKLHELGLAIMQKNGLLSNFQGLDNFASKSTKVSTEKLEILKSDLKKYLQPHDNNYNTSRLNSEKKQILLPAEQKHQKSITPYQRLQQKLIKKQNIKKQNPESSLTKHLQNMSENMKQKIQKLREIRMKIHQSTKNHKKIMKSSRSQKNINLIDKQSKLIKVDSVSKFMARKKQRLEGLRQQSRSPQSLAVSNLKRAIRQSS